MAEQLDIFGAPPREARKPDVLTPARPSIDDRFAAFHQANPHVMAEMLRLARARLDRGDTYVSVKAIWEELRNWLQVTGGDYKLNNDFTAPASRKLIELEPRLAGVIEIRTRKAKTK